MQLSTNTANNTIEITTGSTKNFDATTRVLAQVEQTANGFAVVYDSFGMRAQYIAEQAADAKQYSTVSAALAGALVGCTAIVELLAAAKFGQHVTFEERLDAAVAAENATIETAAIENEITEVAEELYFYKFLCCESGKPTNCGVYEVSLSPIATRNCVQLCAKPISDKRFAHPEFIKAAAAMAQANGGIVAIFLKDTTASLQKSLRYEIKHNETYEKITDINAANDADIEVLICAKQKADINKHATFERAIQAIQDTNEVAKAALRKELANSL